MSSLLFTLYLICATQINATNKFGVHVATPDKNDIIKAAELINTNGSWGYVTLVIREDDRNIKKWQEIFDLLRQKKIIPLVRIATKGEGDHWKKPTESDVYEWESFLNSLNWVTKDRYIILFNEPNSGSEWGGNVDIPEYARIILKFAKSLKESNSDYKVMMGGLDVSAPSKEPKYEDAEVFIRTLSKYISRDDILNYFPIWASHSYPQDFIGSLDGFRKSPKTYKWEQSMIQKYWGIDEMKVFITETNWHDTVANYDSLLEKAFEDIWLPDNTVLGVTLFILNYPEEPFDKFSLLDRNGNGKSAFFTIKNMPKSYDEPQIEENFSLDVLRDKYILTEKSQFEIQVILTNTGQSIADESDGYNLVINSNLIKSLIPPVNNSRPFTKKIFRLPIQTVGLGKESAAVKLVHNGKILAEKSFNIEVVPLPSVQGNISVFPKRSNNTQVAIELFDKDENLVYVRDNVFVVNGIFSIDNIENVIIGDTYRMVVLKEGYLPRQYIFALQQKERALMFKPLLPLDNNKNGKFDIFDIFLFIVPNNFLKIIP